jgi:ubiquitin-conjugating enzyme E2 M
LPPPFRRAQDWKPVLSISSIIYGLQYLFLDPNPDDPLNKEAAEVLRDNPRQFEQNVKRSIAGGQVAGTYFPPALAR